MLMEHIFSTVTLTKTTLTNRMKLKMLDASLYTNTNFSFEENVANILLLLH